MLSHRVCPEPRIDFCRQTWTDARIDALLCCLWNVKEETAICKLSAQQGGFNGRERAVLRVPRKGKKREERKSTTCGKLSR